MIGVVGNAPSIVQELFEEAGHPIERAGKFRLFDKGGHLVIVLRGMKTDPGKKILTV